MRNFIRSLPRIGNIGGFLPGAAVDQWEEFVASNPSDDAICNFLMLRLTSGMVEKGLGKNENLLVDADDELWLATGLGYLERKDPSLARRISNVIASSPHPVDGFWPTCAGFFISHRPQKV